ncbi:HAMP domain-containing sensor histidine kinase [Sinobaca sp. H24]|uniref:histidine kinase dimerization/phospho-acceptor domain-containing protein n=1 Tax=Sinobaca sp. H24 TaxID=2923376 RepID=UPI0020799981|nr:HAMP domain-containing sensor histidine kinase [Sinobaca sp. H24]
MNKNRKVSILRYWTTRYLLTLLIGLLIIAALSLFWIRQTTVDHRLNVTQLVAQEMADRVATEGGESGTLPREEVPDFFQDRQSVLNVETNPLIYIVDNNGESITSNAIRGFEPELAFPASVLEKEDSIQRLNIDVVGNSFLVKAPIIQDGANIGWVVIIQPVNEVAQLNQEYSLVAIMVVALALLGWLTIYILSRRLSYPVKRVSGAAKLVKEQNYNFTLPENIREKEIHELVDSFKEMSARLQRLEKLRTELLAGVTHELKTPVTSISGLLQAVKDDVVTDEEAAEFIDISLKETERMKTMVADLLAFNTFSANGVNVVMEKEKWEVCCRRSSTNGASQIKKAGRPFIWMSLTKKYMCRLILPDFSRL